MSEPERFWIDCEGGGWPPNPGSTCKMCGEVIYTVDGLIELHQRVDLIALIDAGYFEEP